MIVVCGSNAEKNTVVCYCLVIKSPLTRFSTNFVGSICIFCPSNFFFRETQFLHRDNFFNDNSKKMTNENSSGSTITAKVEVHFWKKVSCKDIGFLSCITFTIRSENIDNAFLYKKRLD